MSSERKLAEFQQWVLAVLELLGAEPDRQAEYLRTSGVEVDELLLQFDDVWHVAHARVGDGSLKREDYLLLQSVNERADCLSGGPSSIWSEAALSKSAQWGEIRAAARVARSSLERSWTQDFGD